MGMFDFNDEKLSDEEIVRIAKRDGYSPLRVAIRKNGYRQSQHFWGNPDASSIYDSDVLGVVVKRIRKMATDGKGVIGIRSLYNDIRKIKRFDGGIISLMARLQDDMLPALEKMNLACLIGDKIYAHPVILDESWQPNFKAREDKNASRLPYHLRYSEEEVEVAMEFYRKAKSLLNGE